MKETRYTRPSVNSEERGVISDCSENNQSPKAIPATEIKRNDKNVLDNALKIAIIPPFFSDADADEDDV